MNERRNERRNIDAIHYALQGRWPIDSRMADFVCGEAIDLGGVWEVSTVAEFALLQWRRATSSESTVVVVYLEDQTTQAIYKATKARYLLTGAVVGAEADAETEARRLLDAKAR